MSDQVFAALAETTMTSLSTEQAQTMLVTLARFEIEAFERARRIAPARSAEAAAFDLAREAATQETLRRALFLRDREVARAPLRNVAQLLGLKLDEEREDWLALAIEATRVLLDVSAERARRDQGCYTTPSPAFTTAMTELDRANTNRLSAMSPAPVVTAGPLLAPLPFASARLESIAPRGASAEASSGTAVVRAGIEVAPSVTPSSGATVAESADTPAPVDDPRLLGSTFLSPISEPPAAAPGQPTPKPVGRPARTPGQEKVFQFYLKILTPSSQAALLRPEGPSVEEAFHIYYELKAKGFADHFHTLQKIPPGKGPKWVDSSGNKLGV